MYVKLTRETFLMPRDLTTTITYANYALIRSERYLLGENCCMKKHRLPSQCVPCLSNKLY